MHFCWRVYKTDCGLAKRMPDSFRRLQKDQRVVFDIQGRVHRKVKTESRVATILKPAEEKQEFSGQLQVKIEDAERKMAGQ